MNSGCTSISPNGLTDDRLAVQPPTGTSMGAELGGTMSDEAAARPKVNPRLLVVGAVVVVVLAAFGSWVLRPAALAQGTMQAFPGSVQVSEDSYNIYRVGMLYTQKAGERVSYELTVLNDSPWALTITGASVAAGSASDVFADASVDLPERLVLAPGDEESVIVHATFAKCLFVAAATTNPNPFAFLPGVQVAFRQFGIPRTQLIDVRQGYAGIHTC